MKRALRAVLVLAALALGVRASAEEAFRSAPHHPFVVEHIALDLDVDLEKKAIKGKASLNVQAVRDLAHLELDAVALEVESVSVARGNGQPEKATFTNDGWKLDVAATLKRGEKARLDVLYGVRDPRSGLHFYAPSKKEPEVPLQVWSQGEARTNRFWFPCVDNPHMRQTTELTAHVPAGFECLSNGALVEKKDEDGGKKTRFHWKQARPHVAYLVTLVVGKFHVAKEEWRGRPVTYYVPEKRAADIPRSFANTKAMLDFFSDKIGVEYPWEKYAQVVVEQFSHGGMENTSATTLNERTLHDERAHMDVDSEGLVAHELAHQWWGDLITCHDWKHIWLNEGFASYFEALWDEKLLGTDEFEYNLYEKGHGARDEQCKKRPVVDERYPDPETVFDSRAYPKGAWILHGLRKRVGDEAFWRAINHYAKKHQYTTVETVDLRRAFEAETGLSLERYFRDLTARPGHPVLDVAYEWRSDEKVLEATIKQTQPGEAFAVETSLAYGDDPASAKRVSVVFENEKEKRVVVPLAARPAYVRLDPSEGVLKELTERKGEDQWLLQLAKDPNVVGRIRAAHALADGRAPRALEAIAKQLLEDPFWGVSVECARALGRAGGDLGRDGLIRGLAHKSSKVRRAVIEALQGWRRDEAVIAAVRPFAEKDPSYYVEAAATSTYAALRAKDARAVLDRALAKKSHNEVIRENAIYGLASLEDPEVLPVLEKLATEPGDHHVRRAAVSALGRLAALPSVADQTREKVVLRLVKLVEEEGMRLRWTAVDALGGLGGEATAALSALDAVAKVDPEGRLRDAAKRAADRVRAGTPPNTEVARLREEVQQLKEREEKLLRRIERVEARSKEPAPSTNGAERKPDPARVPD